MRNITTFTHTTKSLELQDASHKCLYLNDVEEGGETYFLNLGIKIIPKAGRELMECIYQKMKKFEFLENKKKTSWHYINPYR